jgi:PBP1b-binding outer membrane lipoprotein LpoB
MKPKAIVTAVFASILLAGCSSGSSSDPSAEKEPAPEDKALLNAVQKPMDKARQVEQQLQDADQAQRRQIDEQSQ